MNCRGRCCTFEANSVQITPLETLEIYRSLEESNRWNEELKKRLEQTIKDYRLDYDIPTTRGLSLRKTYTCPFFNHGPKGCSLDREIKPYGCLGFNPLKEGNLNGENCGQNNALLEKREQKHNLHETELNQQIANALGLEWKKLPIPMALLDFDRKYRES